MLGFVPQPNLHSYTALRPWRFVKKPLSNQANTTIMNAVEKLTELVSQKLDVPNSVILEVPITNNFSTMLLATHRRMAV
ncbi:MAG: hypothetical protein V7K27_01860 [Nostoc sp.]|uniref:hypothetical protein n=1 Tax=Nostoc sp. TaxID=1180 RepID=UPI002FFAB0B9